MARTPVISLTDIKLTFGGEPVLDGVSVTIQEGDRVALVGRNGSGKSTLMKVMGGLVEPDSGGRVMGPGYNVATLEQAPSTAGFATLGDFARDGVEPAEWYKVDQALEGLKIDADAPVDGASGGEVRRAALAQLMAADAEVLLLDEPTNHLDIEAILWLEETLKTSTKAFVLISHDRAFMSALTNRMIWVDRGQLRSNPRGFDRFEQWRDETYEQEDLARHKRDRLIKAESRWAVEGISARRTRDMGRVRRLRDMKADRAAERRRVGTAELEVASSGQSGRLVAEAKNVSLAFGDTVIAKDFSIRVMRGDRLAFVGPNGVGKTTLVKMLTGDLEPDGGSIRRGVGVEPIFFDQSRASLDEDASLWDTLTGDSALGVQGKNDQVMVRGAPRHVAGYLRDFLFEDVQMRGPVRALSGGEKARLLLAKNLARPCNLMVMDEPTNDLDLETLDLLEEAIVGFEGTVILISHDRDFVDRIAEKTIAMQPGGRVEVHAGGYSDALAHGAMVGRAQKSAGKPSKPRAKREEPQAAATNSSDGLSFTESHRLEALPDEIARVEAEIVKLETFLAMPDIFTREAAKAAKASQGLGDRQKALAAMEAEWLELAEKAESG